MSSELKADRQFDFGGIDEFATRFKLGPNALYTAENVFLNEAGALENYPKMTNITNGALSGGVSFGRLFGGNEPNQSLYYALGTTGSANLKYRNLADGTSLEGAIQVASIANPAVLISGRQGWRKDSAHINCWDGTNGIFISNEQTVVAGAPSRILLARHLNYFFLIGTAANGANNRYSQAGTTTFPTLSDFDVGRTNNPILAACSLRGNLYEFKPNETWVVTGRGPGNATGGGQADFNAFLVSTSVGCS